jgi:glycosyltransferase involved in cell wall biosynthesis
MKVLHVIPAVAPRYGGPSQAVVQMCQALRSEDMKVLIATTDADGEARLAVEIGKPVVYEGVPTIFFPRQLSEAFKYSRPLGYWLDSNVNAFDVVHIHAIFSHSSLAAAGACQRHHVPYVLRPLGSLDPWSLNQKRVHKRALWHIGVKRMLGEAAAIHYTAEAERRLAEEGLGLNHGVVIPLGVNGEILQAPAEPETFRRHYPSLGENPYVLVLSRLHPKKGLELLFDIFLDVTSENEFKHWRLVVAGEGESRYESNLKRLVEKRQGGERVLFTGWLDGAQKVSALQGSALLALPSRQENFGLSVVEAMACGVPVLISPQVNLADEIQTANAGWVVNLEREALAKTFAETLSRQGERASRGDRARDFAHSYFAWPKIAAELTQLYRSVTKH